ncbi:MAG: aldo/keto reductase [Treponema sp.]|uniref:aldo/keto reductase n=1 Tax=Treponema sp. TaxID=166 RepID=UPI001B78C0E0|nr:aldo/keto reductase [Treponema sp.]MBP5403436.1 aldo/keto reductase [Treponema sp.]MBR5933888.1 aldo/keto reductase [Treponema sp.]
MEYIALGRSNLLVSRVGFGAMSLNEIDSEEDAAVLIHKAYDAGINFFDISHSIPESEKRLGACLSGIRQHIILATKSDASTKKELLQDLDESLYALQSDYVDLFQYDFSNDTPMDFKEIKNVFELMRERGKVKHFGFATQNLELAEEILKNDFFEIIQFPFNVLTNSDVLDLVKLCQKKDVGFIAMKPLYGGLVQNIPLAEGFFHQYENVVPLWGVRTVEELNQILYFNSNPPVIDDKFKEEVDKVRLFFS